MTKKLNFLGAFILAAVFIILTPYSLANKKINYLRAEVIIRPDYQIKSDQVWTAEQGPYIIQENCPIVAGAKLTIRPGTIVKFYEAGRIYSFGEIKVEGTAADPVYFTSIYDNAAGGDNCAWSDKSPWPGSWGTITSIYGGRIIADHAIFKYGGNNQAISGGLKSGVIFVWAGSGQVNIINSEFTENIRALFNYLNSDAPVAINNSKIYNNAYGGVWASFIISNNYSGSHINVTNNWWGHESGPYYKDFNPDGQGNAICYVNQLEQG